MNKVMGSAMSKGVPHKAAAAISGMFAYDENQYKDHWAHKVQPGDMLKIRGDNRLDIKNKNGWVKVESITPTCVTIDNGYSPAFIGTAYFYPPDEAGEPPFTLNRLIPIPKKENSHNYIAVAILLFIVVAVLITI